MDSSSFAQLEVQGEYVRVRVPGTLPTVAGMKKPVTEFTAKSRKAMLDTFAKLNYRGHRVSFVTLTFHGSVSYRNAKTALRRFFEWLRYHHPVVSGIWRMELQKRGVPHFHLILWNLPFVKQDLLQKVWSCCTGELLSIVHITLLRDHRQAWSYVSKYAAKVSPSLDSPTYPQNGLGHPGRWWGFHNKANLPFAEGYTLSDIPMEVFWRFRRHFRRFRPYLGGRAGGFTLYSRASHQWLRLAGRLMWEYNCYEF